MKKKRKISLKIIIVAVVIILITFAAAFFIFNSSEKNANYGNSALSGTQEDVKYEALSQDEINKISNAILSSEFIKDIPEGSPISITFFKFENGERVWQGGFLIGNNQLLQSGEPAVSIIIHSKYISELNGNNLCDIIKEANKNGDLAIETEYSTASLIIKYAGLLKYRDCFGF